MTTTLQSNALTTLAIANADLGVSGQDTTIERYINIASNMIEQYCRRKFQKATVTSEKYRAPNDTRLILKRTPLVSITSIVVDGATVAAADYEIEDADKGFVWRDAGCNGDGMIAYDSAAGRLDEYAEAEVVATYVGGYVLPNDTVGTKNMPVELEQACLHIVNALYRAKGADVTGDAFNPAGPMGAYVKTLLAPYVRRVNEMIF